MKITDINTRTHLRRLDLNLLLVFNAVMAERNVTHAGRRLSMSQSAVSNALNRLRDSLGDKLFVRGRDGMMPTERALGLAGPIRNTLQDLEFALAPPKFDPATERRTFRLAVHEYLAAILMPELVVRLSRKAPGVNLYVVPNVRAAPELLDTHAIDFALTPFLDQGQRFANVVLLRESFVCVMRKDHPLARRKLTLEGYLDAKHLLIAPTGEGQGRIDRALEARGLARRVAIIVNQHALAPRVVASSDMILTMAKRMAVQYAPLYDLKVARLPLAVDDVEFWLMWHTRLGNRPAQDWLREQLLNIARSI